MEYGYVRISTKKQNMERQIRNIKSEYPNAEIYQEIYTGTKLNKRIEFQKLLKIVKTGDKIIFDSVSRMSRTEKEGIKLYLNLYNKGVELVFLKEKYINTSIFRSLRTNTLTMTGTNIDTVLESINEYLMSLAEQQVKIAFAQSEKEVKDLRQRTKEGIETARLQGKQIGQKKGKKLHIKKKEPSKKQIKKLSKYFDGNLSDREVIKKINIAPNTYYKYKKELRQELDQRIINSVKA